MIKFACILCGEKIGVQEQLAGKRIRCPKCSGTAVVPAESPRIKFTCQNCGQGIRVLQIHAGKDGKCPKCQNPIVVPPLTADPVDGSETVTVVCSMCGEHMKMPKGTKERFAECPGCGSNVETSLRGEPVASDSTDPHYADEDEYDDESDLPEEEMGLDRRVIFAVSGAALVIVVGLIILLTVVLPSGSGPAEEPDLSPRTATSDSDSSSQPATPSTGSAGTFTLEPPKENVVPKEPESLRPVAGDRAGDHGLVLRLKPGLKHSVRMIKEEKVSQPMTGQRQDIISTGTTELEFAVEQVDPNGMARLKVTYLAIKEEGRGLAAKMRYDSTTPDVQTEHPFAPTYSAMIGQSFTARVTSQGVIAGLEGIDEMFLRVAERIVGGEDEVARKKIAQVRDQLMMNPMISDKRINDVVGNLIVVYPGRTVEVGDSWQAKRSLFSLGTAGLDCTYTLKERTPTAIFVGVSAEIDLQDEPVAAGVGSVGSATTTLKGTYEGTLEIDPISGWLLRKEATMNCSGNVKISPNAQMPQGMTLPVSMETIITVEPVE